MPIFPKSHPYATWDEQCLSLGLVPASDGRSFSYPILFGHAEGESISDACLLEYGRIFDRMLAVDAVEHDTNTETGITWDEDVVEQEGITARPNTPVNNVDGELTSNDSIVHVNDVDAWGTVSLTYRSNNPENDFTITYSLHSHALFNRHQIDLAQSMRSIPPALREPWLDNMEDHLIRLDDLTASLARDLRDMQELLGFTIAQMERCHEIHRENAGSLLATPGLEALLVVHRTKTLRDTPGMSFERAVEYIKPVYLLPLSRAWHALADVGTTLTNAVLPRLRELKAQIERWDRTSRAVINTSPRQVSSVMLRQFDSFWRQRELLRPAWTTFERQRQVLDYEDTHDLPEAWLQRNETLWDAILARVNPDVKGNDAVGLPGQLPLQVQDIPAGFWPLVVEPGTEGRQVVELIGMLRVRMRMKIRAEVRFQLRSVVIWDPPPPDIGDG